MREESYTLSYTGNHLVVLTFSMPGVGNVGFSQNFFLRRKGWCSTATAFPPTRFWLIVKIICLFQTCPYPCVRCVCVKVKTMDHLNRVQGFALRKDCSLGGDKMVAYSPFLGAKAWNEILYRKNNG